MAARQFAVCLPEIRANSFYRLDERVSLSSSELDIVSTVNCRDKSVTIERKLPRGVQEYCSWGGMLNNISAGASVHGITGKLIFQISFFSFFHLNITLYIRII